STRPSRTSNQYPTTCNQSSTQTATCPGSSLTSAFSTNYAGLDFGNPQWSVQILDDPSASGGANYYSDTLHSSPTTYDQNGDNRLWIRAEATLLGQRKIVVAQAVRQAEAVALP